MNRALQYLSGMNSLEQRWADHLDVLRAAGEIAEWRYEPLKLKLAGSTFYTPDFIVLHKDQHLSIDEVKGFWRDDARVKLKVAAEMFPWWEFRAITQRTKKAGGGWAIEQFGPKRP